MEAAVTYRKPTLQKGISRYQTNSILNASPQELIMKLYDLAILSIKKGDYKKANLVLTELIGALNFEYNEVALGFFKLYRYCQEKLYKKESEEPLNILKELRRAWAQAFHLE